MRRVPILRSLRFQLAFGGAVSTTLTVAALFAIGYQMLDGHLRSELDRLIDGHFLEIKMRLGPDVHALGSRQLEQRLRETSDFSSSLFLVEVEAPGTGVSFRSSNMGGAAMPDVSGQRVFEAVMPGAGPLRVHENLLPGLDVAIAMKLTPLRQTMDDYVQTCAWLLCALFVISLATGWWLGRIVLKPLSAISNTARRIGRDDLNARISVAGVHAEMEGLVRLLNAMFDRLEIAFDQIRRFADEASHELKTPLTLIRLHAERLLQGGTLSPPQEEAVGEQLEELTHLNHIIDDLLFLSRVEADAVTFHRQRADPSAFLLAFAQDATVLATDRGCRFELVREGTGAVLMAENWLRQLLLNLLSNALAVSPPNGTIQLRSSFGPARWTVLVQDDGPGLDEAARDRMFERFVRFNVSPDGERGSGLGLAIARKIAELHGGRLFARPRLGQSGLQVVFEMAAEENFRD